MGSASGRRKCCESFFLRGYDMGFSGRGRWSGRADDAPWDDNEALHLANTVSASFAGLFKRGFALGCEDRTAKREKRAHAYYDYKVKKADSAKSGDILNLLDQGYILRYDPNRSGWPHHPFTISSPPGGIVYRRSAADVVLAQDAEFYKYRKLLADVMAEAIDAGYFGEQPRGKRRLHLV